MKFPLLDPIDYEALSKAYSAARWRWAIRGSRSFPSPEEIKRSLEELRRHALIGTGYCSSGGLTVEVKGVETLVSIDGKLNAIYQATHPYPNNPIMT